MTDNHKSDRRDPADDVVQAASTSREAFGRLYDHFYPSIIAYCSRRMLVRAVAEDVTSEIFLKVAAGIRDFHGTCCEDFRRWLFRITTNEINAHLRQSIRRGELLEEAVRMGKVDATVSTLVLDRESDVEWAEVYRALGELTAREQSIISLRFFVGFTHGQIADVLEVAVGTVRVTLSRALARLRGRLRDFEISPTGDALYASRPIHE